jgi:predicted O-methyltransferase YrrM
MLDDRVHAVLARMEQEDRREREQGLPSSLRSRQVAPTTGRFLFALAAPQPGCSVLEIGGSRGYSSIWLAAGSRLLGGSVVSLEVEPARCEAWRRNIAEAGLDEWASLIEGEAGELLREVSDDFDLVFIDAEKEDYERLYQLVRDRLQPGAVVVADNVLSHEEWLGAYSRARQEDPTLSSVTVPLDRGLEVSVVLSARV